jgi:acetyl esterase/lipase
MPQAGCGLAPYEWLPRERVGHVVSYQESVENRFAPSTVDLALGATGGGRFFSPVPFGDQLFRLRYTTQDKGKLVEATGLVAVPWKEGDARQSFPMVLFLHGTTGFMGKCAPSYRMGDADVFGLVLLASLGYIVVAPDYIGLDAGADFSQPPPVKHHYLGIEQTAVGSLDMVRAARELLTTKVQTQALPASALVLWGASQGGHAALAADLVAPYYAPELEVRATVALVPPTDLLGLAQYALSGVNPATQAFAAVMTAMHFWYEGQEGLDTLLCSDAPRSLSTEVPRLMYSGCEASGLFDGVSAVSQVFVPSVLEPVVAGAWGQVQPWACYLRENSIPWTSIRRLRRTPTLFVLSGNDTLVYTPPERADFLRLCSLGYELQYLECEGAGHAEGAVLSLPEQVAWVKDRLAGRPIAADDLCRQRPAVRCSGQPNR